MGFRPGYYATVWEVSPQESYTKIRISTTRKNKQTGEYEQDFSGYVLCIGEAKEAAVRLREKDRIKIGGCDVTSFYNKETKKGGNTFKMFDFELADSPGGNQPQNQSNQVNASSSAAGRKPSFDFEGDGDEPF